jgi:hypothetical protein
LPAGSGTRRRWSGLGRRRRGWPGVRPAGRGAARWSVLGFGGCGLRLRWSSGEPFLGSGPGSVTPRSTCWACGRGTTRCPLQVVPAGRCPTAPLPVGPMASMAPTNSHFGEPHVGDDVRSRGTCEPQISSHKRVIVWCSNRASDGNAILLLTPDVSQSGSDGRHSSWTYRNRGVRDVVGSSCLSRVRERPS